MPQLKARLFAATLVLAAATPHHKLHAQQAQPHTLSAGPRKSITLSLPASLDIAVAARNLPRVRFFAQSPDGRIFATSMYSLADNTRGAIYILDGLDAKTHVFTRITPYLTRLRNPNNLAFYTDAATHQTWLYVPLTDRLVRYRYTPGDTHPTSAPETLMRFPDYGLSYKYGGWHLTRTVAIATLHGRTRVFVAVGSSCNYCREREAQRASIVAMNPDGGQPQIVAHGMRNAVDLRFIPGLDGGALFASNMGDDHLGDQLPEDTFFELDSNARPGPLPRVGQPAANFGWPTCYFASGKPMLDKTPLPADATAAELAPKPSAPDQESVYAPAATRGTSAAGTNLAARIVAQSGLPDLGTVPAPLTSCANVPAAYTTFAAHSSPLGLAFFNASSPALANSFLVALHGAGHPRLGTGYRVTRFTPANRTPRDFITGFLTKSASQPRPSVHGRPCGILPLGPDTFLLSDDYLNLVYIIFPKS